MARALMFPGQGAQYVGMAMDLAERYPLARDLLAEADDALSFGLSDVIANGPDEDLMRTDISQPAILCASWIAFRVVESSCNPLLFDACAGLSLGEYTALVAADAMSFADAIRLVRLRGQAMQDAADAEAGGMVALIGADEASAQSLCDAAAEGDVLAVANLNSVGQVVIAGQQAACERAAAIAKEHGIRRATPLKVAGAFHSPLMAPAADRLKEALAAVSFKDPSKPVYANAIAAPVTSAAAIPDLLVRQLTSPVRWAESLQLMFDQGCDEFVELGPGKTLCGMLSRTVKEARALNVDAVDDVLPAVGVLRG